ncbi:hypothetical protein [Methylomagnum sp.]
MREFAVFIMRSPWIAGLVAGLLGVVALKVPPFAILSGAVVALVALRRGWPYGLMVAVGAGALVAAGWFGVGSRPGLEFPLVLALWPPLLVATETLRRTESQGMALLVVGGVIAIYAVAMHAVTGDVVAFWHEWLKHAVTGVPGATVKGFEENDTLRLMNGFLGVLYGLSLMLSLLFGRWLQSLAYHPGGFGPEFQRLRLSRLVLLTVVAIISGAGAWNQILVADLFMAGILVYFFVGLAVIHGVVAMRGLPAGWTLPIYIALIYFPQFVLAGLALLGALDTFVNFRAQKAKPSV